MYTNVLIACLIGYLLGSIPFALVIGKVFYNTDVREHGSGNLGGSNAGRILGKYVGMSVIILDVVKVIVAILLCSLTTNLHTVSIWAGVAAAFGHCYPIFAGFRGGKAVTTMFGFLIGVAIFTFSNPWMFFIPFLTFLVILVITKMVSLSSMIAAITSTIYIACTIQETQTVIASCILMILIIYRHRSNISRILQGSENKITFLSRKK